MKNLKKILCSTVISSGLLFSHSAVIASESTAVPSTINWTIPFGVGGGTDVWARFISPYMTKHMSGAPTVVIKNQPGGGSITGTNLFYSRAAHDGSDILGTSASTLYPYMLGDKRVRYNFDGWMPLLASPTGGVVFIQTDLGIGSADDVKNLKGITLPFASQGPTQLELPVLIALDLLGLDIKPVFGMKSRGEGRLAFERGEAKIDFQTSSAYLSSVVDLVEANKALPLFSLGILNEQGKIVRDPAFADLPTFEEVYFKMHGKEPSGLQYDAYRKFFAAGFAYQKVIFIPQNTPSELIAEYRVAIDKMLQDPDFISESAVQVGPYTNVTGVQAAQYLSESVTLSPELYQWVSGWLKSEFNFSL